MCDREEKGRRTEMASVWQPGCGSSHAAIPRLTAVALALINSQPSVLSSPRLPLRGLTRPAGPPPPPQISPSHNVLTSLGLPRWSPYVHTPRTASREQGRGMCTFQALRFVYSCDPLVFVMGLSKGASVAITSDIMCK